jgi:large subunit ribosomal protein L4
MEKRKTTKKTAVKKAPVKKDSAVKKEAPVKASGISVAVYDKTGKEIKQIQLPKEIFGVTLNSDLVYQVLLAQRAMRRQGTANTKGRGEVRGGGKKPWKQKGTGRARHGSSRSPIWIGGGVTFGPTKEKNYKQKINKQMKRKALFMVLSSKAKNGSLVVLDDLKIEEPKTKVVAGIISKLPVKNSSCLMAFPSMSEKALLAARNIVNIKTIQARELNVLEILNSKYLLLPEESLKIIEETFLNQK